MKKKIIKRFLIETNVKYRVKVDMFIHGRVNDFIWASAKEAADYLENTDINSTSVHSAKLYIQSWNKNIAKNEKYEHCRDYIQAKWFSMYDDIIIIMTKR